MLVSSDLPSLHNPLVMIRLVPIGAEYTLLKEDYKFTKVAQEFPMFVPNAKSHAEASNTTAVGYHM